MDMRGLKNFIKDIREVSDNRDAEVRRVEQELAKIRSKFKSAAQMTPYDRKKYVCKLLFIFMLGYKVEFGHMEFVQLLGGDSASEKLIGYLAMSLFLHEGHELLTLTTHTVTVDLAKGDELRRCLALTAVANIGGRDFAESMHSHLQTLVCNKSAPTLVRKKAFLATLRIHRKFKGIIDADIVAPVAAEAINAADLSLSLAAATTCLGFLQDPTIAAKIPHARTNAIKVLEKVIIDRASPPELVHCGVPSPWLQAKLVRLLQEFPPPTDVAEQEMVSGVLSRIVRATTRTIQEAQTSSVSRNDPLLIRCNCMVSVLSEIISLVIEWEVSSRLLTECRDALGLLLNDRKGANRRYVGLTLLTRMSFCRAFYESETATEGAGAATFAGQIAKYQPVIVASMHDADDSLKKSALDLLYAMCDEQNAPQIVGELLEYLPISAPKFREDLVLMIAILAEKFCGDISWYVDVFVTVLEQAGDVVTDDVWQRLVHVAVNVHSVQTHAVDAVYRALTRSKAANYALLRVGALLLGEFGYQIAMSAGSSAMDQVMLVASKMPIVPDIVKAMLLSTLVKFYNLYDNKAVREKIKKLLQSYKTSLDAELQQRATEYFVLISEASDDVLQAALEPIPPFEVRAGSMTEKLRSKHKGEARDLWNEKGGMRDAAHLRKSAVLREAAAVGLSVSASDVAAAQAQVETAAAARKLQGPSHVDPSAAAEAAVRDGVALAQRLASAKNAAASGDGQQARAAPVDNAPPRTETPPAKPAAPKHNDDLDALFGNVSAPPKPAAPLATSGAASASGARDSESAARRAFGARFMQTSVLYDEDGIRINCRVDHRGADARASVTITNTSDKASINNLSIRIGTAPANLMLQMQPLGQQGPMPPNATVTGNFASRCLATFEGQPSIQIAGEVSGRGLVSLAVKLPFCSTTFLEPYKLEDKAKFEAFWGNTRGADVNGAATKQGNVRVADARGDVVAAVESCLFKNLSFFTMRASPTKIYGIAAHAFMPSDTVQYTPVLVIADCGGAGAAASTDDPFGFLAPAQPQAARPASGSGTVTIETKCPDAPLQHQVHEALVALLQGEYLS